MAQFCLPAGCRNHGHDYTPVNHSGLDGIHPGPHRFFEAIVSQTFGTGLQTPSRAGWK